MFLKFYYYLLCYQTDHRPVNVGGNVIYLNEVQWIQFSEPNYEQLLFHLAQMVSLNA